jgi:hypothetical protein
MCLALPALALEGGEIGVFPDVVGADCNILDLAPGLLSVHVIHYPGDNGAVASEFAAPMPACMTLAFWLSDTTFGITPGNSQVGISIGYGNCYTQPIHILTINYFVQGMSEPCCHYPVVAHPQFGAINAVDCNNQLIPAAGITNTVNGDATCPCPIPDTVPVHESTWGQVKALYTD